MFYQNTFLSQARGLFKSLAALGAIAALSSCASFQEANSSLPVEVVHDGAGQLLSFRAYESADRLYVAGAAKEHSLTSKTHVDIQLLNASGRVLAEKQDDIDPAHPAPGGGHRKTDTYVASFPLSEARQAAKVRITYHGTSHSIL